VDFKLVVFSFRMVPSKAKSVVQHCEKCEASLKIGDSPEETLRLTDVALSDEINGLVTINFTWQGQFDCPEGKRPGWDITGLLSNIGKVLWQSLSMSIAEKHLLSAEHFEFAGIEIDGITLFLNEEAFGKQIFN